MAAAIVTKAAAIVTMAIVAAVAAVVGRSGRRRCRRNRRNRQAAASGRVYLWLARFRLFRFKLAPFQ